MAYTPFDPPRTQTCRICGNPPEDGLVLRCERCRAVFYCSEACRDEGSGTHPSYCRAPRRDLPTAPPPRPVAGVRLLGGNDVPFSPQRVSVPPGHPVWRTGSISPLSQLLDMPILIHRERREAELGRDNIADLDNQAVTYFMVDPETGIAPARWQKNIGEVVIVRANQQPLAMDDLENLFVFCKNLLGIFTFTRRSPDPARAYTREALQILSRRYREACQSLRAGAVQESLDFTADPVPLQEIPLEPVAEVPDPSRGVEWISIGPPRTFSIPGYLPNGQFMELQFA